MKRLVFILSGVCLFNLTFAYAQECGPITNAQDVVNCAMKNHPAILGAERALLQGEDLEAAAGQRPNPELASKFLYGKTQGDVVINGEATLTHSFELGGKRDARIGKAAAEKETLAVALLKTQQDVYLGTSLYLVRLRQLAAEIPILEEALTHFSRIQTQFRSRVKLAPEQEVSRGVFQLAEQSAQLMKASLLTEQKTLKMRLELAIGMELPNSPNLLPQKKKVWPSFSEVQEKEGMESASVKEANAQFKFAQAELDLAKSASWPDLKLGPAFQTQAQGVFNYSSYGVTFTLPIPLFHVNSSGRSYAFKGLERSEQNLTLRKKEAQVEKKIQLTQYQSAVKILGDITSASEAQKKHQNMESLFSRGVIPSSLIIEAHRQIFEFHKAENEQELVAIESLLRIYALEGRLFEEKI